MITATETFTTDNPSELVRIVYVPGIGIRAERGMLEHGVFVQTHAADELLFSDRDDLVDLYDFRSNEWNQEAVTSFLFDKPAGEVTHELRDYSSETAKFNEWMDSL